VRTPATPVASVRGREYADRQASSGLIRATVRLDAGGRDSCGITAPSPGPRESRSGILSDYALPLRMPLQIAIPAETIHAPSVSNRSDE
jgi:hypothetical protein